MTPRKIAFVTGTRADYGLLYCCLREAQASPHITLQTVVTGTHLEARFGHTVDVIRADGFTVDCEIPLGLADQSPRGVLHAMSRGLAGFAEAFEVLRPDIVVVLGDRYEIQVAAQAAMVMRIPLAHIHGGELTEGLIDEAIRHSVTKMAQFHFVAHEEYRRRVIQLGEDPVRVICTGAPGLDFIRQASLMDRPALEASLGFSLKDETWLVTYHPVTLDDAESMVGLRALCDALAERENATVVFSMPNADPGGDKVWDELRAFAQGRPGVHLVTSLGQVRYLSVMKHARAVVGNSSSGILEAPFMGTPTVNIGNRQRGRLQAPSVLSVSVEKVEIRNALRSALGPEFQKKISNSKYFFGDGTASKKIVSFLENVPLDGVILKTFHDL
jgi:UDP-hydrolysing UDP-N-acetyl-D-glucosamine 2-epimerase